MKKLISLFLLFVPTAAYIAISQLKYPIDGPVKAVYAVILFFMFLVCLNNSVPKNQRNGFSYGLLKSLAIFLCFVLIFDALPLGGFLAKPLVPKHSTQKADAIFVLAAGTTPAKKLGFDSYQRITHGIELLKAKKAPRLFFSSGSSKALGNADYKAIASFTALFNLNPSSYAILSDKSITTTQTEALYAYKCLSRLGCKKILLVTSGDHMTRAIATFKKAGFEALAAPAHNTSTVVYAHASSNSYLASLHASLHEIIGYCWYYLRGWL